MPQYHANTIGLGVTLLTPSADGISGQALTTDGSGGLSFSTVGAASPLTLTANSASEVPLQVVGASGQTANLQEWQDENSDALVEITSSGNLNINQRIEQWAPSQYTNMTRQYHYDDMGGTQTPRQIEQFWQSGTWMTKGVAGTQYNHNAIIGWQCGTSFNSAVTLDHQGEFKGEATTSLGSSTQPWQNAYIARLWAKAPSAAVVPSTVKAATSQTANLQEWTDSSDNVMAKADASGYLHAKRVYFDGGLGGYAYVESASSGYAAKMVDRYGTLFETFNAGINFSRSICFGGTYHDTIGHTNNPKHNMFYTANHNNTSNSQVWLTGRHGASGYEESGYLQNGTGVGILCGYGTASTDGDGGDAGTFEVLLNKGGSNAGGGVAGADGMVKFINDDDASDPIVFVVGYDGKTAINRNSQPTGAMLEITSLSSGDDGLEIIAADATGVIKTDQSTTAGETRLLLYDVDNGQLERVTVGAADSGGSGYKVLRIPN